MGRSRTSARCHIFSSIAKYKKTMRCNPVTRVPGSGYEKPSNTESAKQLQERMGKLQAERAKQDAVWTIQADPVFSMPLAMPSAMPSATPLAMPSAMPSSCS